MTSVAIVGAGPAGCAAAIELCRRGHAVALISDAADGVGEQLPPAARPLLQRLGLLPLSQHLECVGVRTAWDAEELAQEDFLLHPFGHGWLLDRKIFGTQLRQRAVAAGADLRPPARLVHLERSGDWRLTLSDGAVVRCDWAIDASGRRAAVAALLGVGRRHFDRQVAVVGWLETDGEDEDATLTVEKASEGWWYTCRLPGRRRVAAWIGAGRPEIDAWEGRLRATRHLGPLVRGYDICGDLVVRPADSSLLERVHGEGWLAIGDTAASHDPLASRGLVSALASGLAAAELLGASPQRLAQHQAEVSQAFHRYLVQRRELYR